jgi:hypothetical protein
VRLVSSQEEAALEAMPDLDDWDEPRAVKAPSQSTKRLRVVSHVDEGQGPEEDLMMLEDDDEKDGHGADIAPASTVTGDDDGAAMEVELLTLMGGA